MNDYFNHHDRITSEKQLTGLNVSFKNRFLKNVVYKLVDIDEHLSEEREKSVGKLLNTMEQIIVKVFNGVMIVSTELAESSETFTHITYNFIDDTKIDVEVGNDMFVNSNFRQTEYILNVLLNISFKIGDARFTSELSRRKRLFKGVDINELDVILDLKTNRLQSHLETGMVSLNLFKPRKTRTELLLERKKKNEVKQKEGKQPMGTSTAEQQPVEVTDSVKEDVGANRNVPESIPTTTE